MTLFAFIVSSVEMSKHPVLGCCLQQNRVPPYVDSAVPLQRVFVAYPAKTPNTSSVENTPGWTKDLGGDVNSVSQGVSGPQACPCLWLFASPRHTLSPSWKLLSFLVD